MTMQLSAPSWLPLRSVVTCDAVRSLRKVTMTLGAAKAVPKVTATASALAAVAARVVAVGWRGSSGLHRPLTLTRSEGARSLRCWPQRWSSQMQTSATSLSSRCARCNARATASAHQAPCGRLRLSRSPSLSVCCSPQPRLVTITCLRRQPVLSTALRTRRHPHRCKRDGTLRDGGGGKPTVSTLRTWCVCGRCSSWILRKQRERSLSVPTLFSPSPTLVAHGRQLNGCMSTCKCSVLLGQASAALPSPGSSACPLICEAC
mmetsp:Transcript_84681/g.169100  ORF Transcript_84681/g.169100 Transcript_84681/m.169100 type:complete len:261 (+) Transcript_84681:384-1166(+)